MKFESSLKLKLIYVFRINDEAHRDCLKVGETTCDDETVFGLAPNSKPLNKAAKDRINEYTQTAGIQYDLLYTEMTIYNKGGLCSFNDKEVHNVLVRSGIKRKIFDKVNKANEWFITDLETVKRAIAAVKNGRSSLNAAEISNEKTPIVFRPEQKDAIDITEKKFKKGNQMLWNAKMRFGKTLSALQVVKDMELTRTLILTHRPVVDNGWFEDFGKIFYDSNDYFYGSKNNGEDFNSLENNIKRGSKYVYFASMQDLRGSEMVGGNFDKDQQIFTTPWNLIIVDEAHEGTQTELGKAVMKELTKEHTKVLRLSGTPFNLFDEFKEDEIYTWDYVMEQRAKKSWDLTHFGDPNPYALLPTLNIYTYDLGRLLHDYIDEDVAFNFREFFHVNEDGRFFHEQDIKAFLNLISKDDKSSLYPFSNDEYRSNFRHTLWMIPGVKEAKALSALLQKHEVFQHFQIVNVAGEGDDDEAANKQALQAVKNAIGPNPEETYTITLSCGRLTTGVSIPAWTAVLMLSGSYSTSASGYMQTIFRVQTPATINGRMKEECYVFDFAPDRTLKVIAETAKISSKAGKTSQKDRDIMGEFLNFCPVISIDGSQMKPYDVPKMLEQLKKVYIERVVSNGFEDGYLYNDELMKLNDVDLDNFKELKGIIGSTKAMPKSNDIDLNNQGFTNEEYEKGEDTEKKRRSGKDISDEDIKLLEERKKKLKQRQDAISILRGISIRMPLLIYGAELNNEDKELTIDNFTSLIDPQSWIEFMPKGVSKQKFNYFKKYYDPEIFCAAGKRIRSMARAADKLSIEERITRIAAIFNTFRNPDKETVLTPWKVVNMHMGDCLGGYKFYNEDNSELIEQPLFIDKGEVTANVFSVDSRILEINSKSGLYPLYVAYSIYRSRLSKEETLYNDKITDAQKLNLWDLTIRDNIFVICKTQMAKSITKRTLVGFRNSKVNTRYFDDLINQITNKSQQFIEKVRNGKTYWKANNDEYMKFNAIVGNPPYQEVKATDKSTANSAFASAIYPKFIDISILIKPKYISLITPSRWMTKQGQGISDSWVDEILKKKNFILIKDFSDATECFPNVEIKGGVNYFLLSPEYYGKCKFIQHNKITDILKFDYLDSLGSGIIIRDSMADKIIHNVVKIEGNYFKNNSFASMVSPKHYFDRNELLNSNWRGYSKDKDEEHTIKYYLNKSLESCGYAWINKHDIPKNSETIKLNKVYIPMAGGTGSDSQVLGIPFYGEPQSVCSYTYLVIGYSAKKHNFSHEECENIIKYIKSRFFRYMVSIKKKTQNTTRELFQFVPLQNFTSNSDIDWSKSVSEIDSQLYAKYELSEEKISFIESTIKEM